MKTKEGETLPLVSFGEKAEGVFAFGNVSTGIFAFGNVARGVFAFGNVAFGSVFAIGNVAVGLVAIGNVAVGPITALGASVACGGLVGRALAMGFGAMSSAELDAIGLGHSAAFLQFPAGLVVGPIAWTIMGAAIAPERPLFSLRSASAKAPRPLSNVDRRALPPSFEARITSVSSMPTSSGDYEYVLEVFGDEPLNVCSPKSDLAKKGDRVSVMLDEQRIENENADYRAMAVSETRLEVRSMNVLHTRDDDMPLLYMLAAWYARASLVAVLAFPIAGWLMMR